MASCHGIIMKIARKVPGAASCIISHLFFRWPSLLPSYVIISLFVVMATILSGACGAGVHSDRMIPLI